MISDVLKRKPLVFISFAATALALASALTSDHGYRSASHNPAVQPETIYPSMNAVPETSAVKGLESRSL